MVQFEWVAGAMIGIPGNENQTQPQLRLRNKVKRSKPNVIKKPTKIGVFHTAGAGFRRS